VKLFVESTVESIRPWKGGAAAMIAILLAMGGGCASSPAPVTAAPEPVVSPSAPVKVDEAWRDAKMVSARAPGSQPAVGTGSSMQPVYGEHTMLVIKPLPYDQLRAGMTVAYVSRQGVRVVHRLVELTEGGWRVMGLNNERADAELVTRKNLLGIIYASFNYDDEPPPDAGGK
jgi:hypothetical protein